MSRPKKILLGVIIFAVFTISFTISVFVKNTHVNHRDPLSNYLDIQMEIHCRMYVLILDIDKRYQNNPEGIKALLDRVERLHKEVIVLGNGNKLAEITISAEDSETLQWMAEQLIWVMKPMSELKNGDAKIIVLIMTGEIGYLHESVRFIAGEKMEEAIDRVEDFKKKFQK